MTFKRRRDFREIRQALGESGVGSSILPLQAGGRVDVIARMLRQHWVTALFELCAAVLLAATPRHGRAHPDIDSQLSALDRRGSEVACDAAMEMRRGELLQSRAAWAEALAAYDRAAECAPGSDDADIHRAALHVAAKQPASALPYLERVLRHNAADSRARLLRAQAFAGAGRFAAAADDFEKVLPQLPQPQPEHFVQRARAQIAAGRDARAIDGLEEGLNRLGPIPLLLRLRVDLQVGRNDFRGALQTLERSRALPNQETWSLRRGEVLEAAGRRAEATREYENVRQAIALRPAARRQTAALRQMDEQARAARQRLQAP